MTRLIDADVLHTLFEENCASECAICTFYENCKGNLYCGLIDNAPTVETTKAEHKAYNEGFKDGVDQGIKLNERPQGKWQTRKQGGYPITDTCTNCRYEMKWYGIKYKYCPECGAKMCKWLYRLESISEDNGLWYNSKNELVWGIGKLPDCKTKDLPMDYDERYHKDGRNWFSSCSRREDLTHWYSLQDALDLIANGFVFTRYLATEYVEYELETTFIKETCLKREVLDIEEVFKEVDND